jgi:hypothetical protein
VVAVERDQAMFQRQRFGKFQHLVNAAARLDRSGHGQAVIGLDPACRRPTAGQRALHAGAATSAIRSARRVLQFRETAAPAAAQTLEARRAARTSARLMPRPSTRWHGGGVAALRIGPEHRAGGLQIGEQLLAAVRKIGRHGRKCMEWLIPFLSHCTVMTNHLY